MNCQKAVELLSEYIDGTLSIEVEEEIKHHIDVCSNCREEYEMLRSIINSCHQLEDIDLPDDFHEKLHNKLIDEKSDKKHTNNGLWIRKSYTAVAAVLIIVISLGVAINSGVLNMGSQKKSSSTEKSEGIRTDTAVAPQAQEFTIKGSQEKSMAKATEESPKTFAKSMADSTKKMVYSVLTVNLSEDEYKKNYDNIAVIIESSGGYLKQKEPLAYLMPEKDLDTFVKKLRDNYGINNISLTTQDITDQYNKMTDEISQLESKQKQQSSADNLNKEENAGDIGKVIEQKKNELNELRSNIGYVYIQINKN